jgi:hypothetical protein
MHSHRKTAAESTICASSDQERRAKVEEARAETERILRGQAAELERKKAGMARRDAERDKAKAAQARVHAACSCMRSSISAPNPCRCMLEH